MKFPADHLEVAEMVICSTVVGCISVGKNAAQYTSPSEDRSTLAEIEEVEALIVILVKDGAGANSLNRKETIRITPREFCDLTVERTPEPTQPEEQAEYKSRF